MWNAGSSLFAKMVQRKAAVILASSDGSLTRCQVLEHAGTTVNNTDKRGSLAVEKGLSFRDVLTGGSQTTWAPTTRLATSTLASMSPAITPQAPTSAPTATRLPPSNEWLRLLLYMTPPHRGYCRPVVHTHWYLQDSLLERRQRSNLKTEASKAALLLSIAGDDVLDVFNNFQFVPMWTKRTTAPWRTAWS
ncbi:uncharacterized protein LOC119178420 isoform X3 [Rhipicephalus microplus]|uniref:uncharacterized protein LOC119178420 isoform X3 n=1 Tax=Rhipicephalus microplus TaxID=6941 RepID=UPI003F6D326B